VDYGKLIEDSFEYTMEGLTKNLANWVILVILTVLPVLPFGIPIVVVLPSLMAGSMPNIMLLIGGFIVAFILAILLSAFYMGYMLRVYRGETPLPAVSGFKRLFIDGIKYIVIGIIYSIPVLVIILVLVVGPLFATVFSGKTDASSILLVLGSAIAGVMLSLIIGFFLMLFFYIGIIRFARTGITGEAFNFRAIRDTIGKIGWGTYILALIIMWVIIIIVGTVLGIIPFIGAILQIVFAPLISIFVARYICLIYDSAREETDPQADLPT
jgi:hypothetical protein